MPRAAASCRASPPTGPPTASSRADHARALRHLHGAHRRRHRRRHRDRAARPVRQHGLSLFFGAIFLAALFGQALVGHSAFNHDAIAHGGAAISLGRYVTSSSFAVDVMENWQSEYLQFTLFALVTVWLVQRGSPESKELGKEGGEAEEDQLIGEHARPDSPKWARAGGWRTRLYSNSLVLVMAAIWLGTWAAQAITGRIDYNAAQLDHL